MPLKNYIPLRLAEWTLNHSFPFERATVPVFSAFLGVAPLRDQPVSMSSYLLATALGNVCNTTLTIIEGVGGIFADGSIVNILSPTFPAYHLKQALTTTALTMLSIYAVDCLSPDNQDKSYKEAYFHVSAALLAGSAFLYYGLPEIKKKARAICCEVIQDHSQRTTSWQVMVRQSQHASSEERAQ